MRIATTFLLIAVLFPVLGKAQQPGQYHGPLRLGSLQGNADFSYTVQKEDTVFEGPFSLHNSNIAEFAERPVSFLSIDGEFEDNVPIENWQWRRGEFFATGKGEVKDHQYQLRISGREHVMKGSFDKGQVHSTWKINTLQIDNSEIKDTLLSAQLSFAKGVPQGDFRIRKRAAQLRGGFQDEGFADGVWRLRSDSLENGNTEWHYSDGQLARIVALTDGAADTLTIAAEVSELAPVAIDEQYFKVLELKIQWSQQKPFVGQERIAMADLLLETLTYFHRTDSIMKLLSQTRVMPPFRAKLARHPYTKEERRNLSAIAKSTDRAHSLIAEMKANPQFNLLKLSDREISFQLAAVSAIERQFVRPIDTVLLYHQKEILEFLPREKLLEKMIPESSDLSITVPFIVEEETTSRIYTMQDTSDFHRSGDDLAAVKSFSQTVVANLENISKKLAALVQEKHREKELVQLEEILMAQYEQVQSTIDSLEKSTNLEDPRVWNSLRQLTETQLSQYSSLSDASQQHNKAKELRSCFEGIENAAASLGEIPAQKQAVEKTYTRRVWNPYTYTHMEETVKKRILNAYNDILLPYFMESIAEAPSCERAVKIHSQLDNLFRKVMELRTENTNRLERKLKRTKKPAEVLKIFGLDSE